jgi:hypothetical protein
VTAIPTATNGLTVVDGVLGALVGEAKALLHNIHAQHPQQANRRPSPFTRSVCVKRRHLCFQQRPRHQLLKIRQEAIPTSQLLSLPAYSNSEKVFCIGFSMCRISARKTQYAKANGCSLFLQRLPSRLGVRKATLYWVVIRFLYGEESCGLFEVILGEVGAPHD